MRAVDGAVFCAFAKLLLLKAIWGNSLGGWHSARNKADNSVIPLYRSRRPAPLPRFSLENGGTEIGLVDS
jgi:hypothetical protein